MCKLYKIAAVAIAMASPALAQETGSASADFMSANGTEAGTVMLTQGTEGVSVDGTLSTVIPGEHGLHVYQIGDCEGASEFATSEVESMEIGKVNADGQGNVTVELTSSEFSLRQGDADYLFDDDGSALILDNGSDDASAPATSSGDPVLCAVLESTPAQ